MNAEGLREFFASLVASPGRSAVDLQNWIEQPYKPRPTIVDAAVALVSETEDPNIDTGLAADDELDRVVDELSAIVHSAAVRLTRCVCFVTGVPGSGKTLVGLRLAHDPLLKTRLATEGSTPLYLSGNGPLVAVLTEALTRDHVRRHPDTKISAAKRHAETLIRLVHGFTSYYGRSHQPTLNRAIIFDEAQRAWDEGQMTRKRVGALPGASEPEMLLNVMERETWAVVIALVGTGQEINAGEAGIETWFEALERRRRRGSL